MKGRLKPCRNCRSALLNINFVFTALRYSLKELSEKGSTTKQQHMCRSLRKRFKIILYLVTAAQCHRQTFFRVTLCHRGSVFHLDSFSRSTDAIVARKMM